MTTDLSPAGPTALTGVAKNIPGSLTANSAAGQGTYDAPTFTAETTYQQGSTEQCVMVGLDCRDIPAGSQVMFRFEAPNPGGDGFVNPIELPWTTVPAPTGGQDGNIVPAFNAGITTNIGANYKSKVTYAYKANGNSIPPGFSISVQAVVVVSQ